MKKIIVGILILFLMSGFTGCNFHSQISPTQGEREQIVQEQSTSEPAPELETESNVFYRIKPSILLMNFPEGVTWDQKTAEPVIVALRALPLKVRKMACSNKPLIIALNPNIEDFALARYATTLNKIELKKMGTEKSAYHFRRGSPFFIVLHEFGHAVDENNQFIKREYSYYSSEGFADSFASYALFGGTNEWLKKNIFKIEPDRKSIWEWTYGEEPVFTKSWLSKEIEEILDPQNSTVIEKGLYRNEDLTYFERLTKKYSSSIYEGPLEGPLFHFKLTNSRKENDENELWLVESMIDCEALEYSGFILEGTGENFPVIKLMIFALDPNSQMMLDRLERELPSSGQYFCDIRGLLQEVYIARNLSSNSITLTVRITATAALYTLINP